jgi:hypothetical protein
MKLLKHVSLAAVAASTLVTGTAFAQQLPTPFALASQLDLECHKAQGPAPVQNLFIRQLNPVLQGHLPNQAAQIGALEDVCVPVAKNNQIPGPNAFNIARWVDLACYDAKAPPVNDSVHLDHLNPVLANLPDENVTIKQLEQVCVPVKKNNVNPPAAVHAIVRHFDFACYELQEPTQDVQFPLSLSHLNPVIQNMNLPNRAVRMRTAKQLCVPIGKNAQPVPEPALSFISWLDFLKYDLTPFNQAAVPAYQQPIPLVLTHLNPLFANAPSFATVLQAPLKLLVPVAKNNVLPPN